MYHYIITFCLLILSCSLSGQDYYYQQFGPFDPDVPSPEDFLGYGIGEYHTRHDLMVGYLEALATASDRAHLFEYGRTHERRRCVLLQVSSADNLNNLESHRQQHLNAIDPAQEIAAEDMSNLPVFVNLGYNVHGNEPSGGEAALLTAYVLVASNHEKIESFRQNGVVFIDPAINPDGRDRHTQWANSLRGVNVLSKDPQDAEHNETWPRGRTNHYWFDLNRDWLLAVHPESQGKLGWYHNWYPNVVTDFHEMGSQSTYFFEPMKDNASKDPIMPEANYTTLNDLFATYYQREMDKLGSLYFTKEVFDGTYPGYGSSYPDLQGGLGILFEQASSRGHIQETPMGDLTFAFTIRNQFVNAVATVEAAVDNRVLLLNYQREFFESALANAEEDPIDYYVIGEAHDHNRMKAFLELLLRHKIEVYQSIEPITAEGVIFDPATSYIIPTSQVQYRMVQTMFETYDEYRDSVFYDASAWSLANAYNISYAGVGIDLNMGDQLSWDDLDVEITEVAESSYAYLIPWSDYNAPGFLYELQSEDIRIKVAQKAFTLETTSGERSFAHGTLIIPVQSQESDAATLHGHITKAAAAWKVQVYSAETGYSISGIDLGSGNNRPLDQPKVAMLIGNGTSGYETGFVWHLLDQRVKMPISKLKTDLFNFVDLSKYNTLILVSGGYNNLDSADIQRINEWAAEGNTLITIGRATSWAVRQKLVKEEFVKKKEAKPDTTGIKRFPYEGARERRGKDEVGGAIFKIDLDITHPIGYGYHSSELPVYRNNNVWIKPSKNEFSNVGIYTSDPHIDGFIAEDVLNDYLKKSASIVVSRMGRGRAVLFSEDPNFRGTWYGTNKLFLNAIFFGDIIRVP